jgi:putative membrane protein insertion efficiency factor
MRFAELASSWTVKPVIAMLRFYQSFVSPFTGVSCRFHPSCSEYSIQAFTRYGLLAGALKTVLRLGKCHPFHPGGYDPVS